MMRCNCACRGTAATDRRASAAQPVGVPTRLGAAARSGPLAAAAEEAAARLPASPAAAPAAAPRGQESPVQPQPQQPKGPGGKAAAAVRQLAMAQPAAPEQQTSAAAPPTAAQLTNERRAGPSPGSNSHTAGSPANAQHKADSDSPQQKPAGRSPPRPAAPAEQAGPASASEPVQQPQHAPAPLRAARGGIAARAGSAEQQQVAVEQLPDAGGSGEDQDAAAILAGQAEPAATGRAQQLVQGAQARPSVSWQQSMSFMTTITAGAMAGPMSWLFSKQPCGLQRGTTAITDFGSLCRQTSVL